MNLIQRFFQICGVMLLGLLCSAVHAQAWPDKPVTIVVPQSAGGGADVLTREVAIRLQAALGQPVVVENKAGAAGIIGTEFVARAAPDGYTFVMGAISTHAINQGLYKKLSYHALDDFVPVVKVAAAPLLVVTNPQLDVNSLSDLIEKSKQNPDQITFGSAGTGNSTHLAGELFQTMTGAKIMHVPFKGATPAEIGLMGNHVDLMFSSIMTAMPHVKEGRMKALAVTSASRTPIALDLMTVDEAAEIKGFDVSPWYGLFAPANTPSQVVARMHDEVTKVLKNPDLQEKFAGMGAEVGALSQAEFVDFVKAEVDKWSQVIKDANISID